MARDYRDRIYIRKDILSKLDEIGEMNQTKLISVSRLNTVKHKEILDDLVQKSFLERYSEMLGKKSILKYKISEKGRYFLQSLLEPYEILFPRDNEFSIPIPVKIH